MQHWCNHAPLSLLQEAKIHVHALRSIGISIGNYYHTRTSQVCSIFPSGGGQLAEHRLSLNGKVGKVLRDRVVEHTGGM